MKWITLVGFLILTAGIPVRAEDDAGAQAIFDKLIAATSAKNYEAFVADGTPNLQAALSKTQFDASSQILAPSFAKGHDTSFLGELNQHGYEVYLYRLKFIDGSDDILGTLTLKDGKVAGILFR